MAAALSFGSLVALSLSAGGALVVGRLTRAAGGGGARFAHVTDVRPLRIHRRSGYGIPLGRHDGHELVGEPNASVALCGPSQVGKSLAAVVRAILRWNGCLIVLSIKEELLRYTLHAREQRGEVKIFDPTGQTGRRTHAWSPVAASETWTQARAIAAGLLQIGQEADHSDREPHWRRTAARYLAPLRLAANQSGQSMRTVLS
jgi:type IV secretory pathway TraG/TraD family ATPase VirD4